MAGSNKIPYDQALPILQRFVEESPDYALRDDPEGPFGSNHTITRGFRRGDPVVFKCAFWANRTEERGLRHFSATGLVPVVHDVIQLDGMGMIIMSEFPGSMGAEFRQRVTDPAVIGPLMEDVGASVWQLLSVPFDAGSTQEDPRRYMAAMFARIRDMHGRLPHSGLLRESLDFQRKWSDVASQQPVRLCIRDIQEMVHEGRLVGFIDLEGVTAQTEAFQLGCVIAGLCNDRGENVRNAAWFCRRFLAGYERARGSTLTEDELCAALAMLHHVKCWRIALYKKPTEDWREEDYTKAAQNAVSEAERIVWCNQVMREFVPSLTLKTALSV